MRARGHTAHAYTLIELVAVIAILAVLVAVASPRLSSSSQNYRARLTATEVASHLEIARANARATRSEVTVTFDPGESNIEFEGVGHPTTGQDPYTIDISASPFRARVTAADFDGKDELLIDAWGRFNVDGVVTIRTGDTSWSLTLDATSGRLEVTP